MFRWIWPLDGEQVPTAEKIYSIFEPHTDLIKRGKVQTPIEFGHKVFLAESARGLITQYPCSKATRQMRTISPPRSTDTERHSAIHRICIAPCANNR